MNSFTTRLSSLGSGLVEAQFISRKNGTYGRITLNHPKAKNALSGKMMVELRNAVSLMECRSDLNLVVLRGQGDFFCSGADLSIAKDIDGASMCSFMLETTTRIRDLQCITVSLVHGGAYGGGAELSTSTDHRVLSSNASVRFVHPLMGISPGWGGGGRLLRLVGRSKAIEIICSSRKLTAKDCEKVGFADYVIDESLDLEEEGLRKYDAYFDFDPTALKACKQAVTALETFGDNSKALEIELQTFSSVWGSEANRNAISGHKKRKDISKHKA